MHRQGSQATPAAAFSAASKRLVAILVARPPPPACRAAAAAPRTSRSRSRAAALRRDRPSTFSKAALANRHAAVGLDHRHHRGQEVEGRERRGVSTAAGSRRSRPGHGWRLGAALRARRGTAAASLASSRLSAATSALLAGDGGLHLGRRGPGTSGSCARCPGARAGRCCTRFCIAARLLLRPSQFGLEDARARRVAGALLVGIDAGCLGAAAPALRRRWRCTGCAAWAAASRVIGAPSIVRQPRVLGLLGGDRVGVEHRLPGQR